MICGVGLPQSKILATPMHSFNKIMVGGRTHCEARKARSLPNILCFLRTVNFGLRLVVLKFSQTFSLICS